VLKKMRPKGKKSARDPKEDTLRRSAEVQTAQKDMQNYYVAVFALHKFDISGGQKALEA
jgi:hypothetical protein